jgi:hypothetical protein
VLDVDRLDARLVTHRRREAEARGGRIGRGAGTGRDARERAGESARERQTSRARTALA